MPRRPASITQADIARALRAAKAEGWPVVRIVTPDGHAIEMTSQSVPIDPAEPKRRPVL